MCGRAVLNTDIRRAVAEFALERHPDELTPRFNIAPGYSGVGAPWIVKMADDGLRELVKARWWLIPSWWSQPLKKLPTAFNARAETVATSRFYRDAFRRRRCLMPVNGWYEFQGKPGAKRSFCFHQPGWQLFGFAGVYETWIDPDHGEVVTSFSIITCEPSEQAAQIHDRMPVIVAPEHYGTWLDRDNQDLARLQSLLRPWDRPLHIYETRGIGNNPRHEGPDCVLPLSADV